jgi:Ca-activated chloride channel homolog
VPRRNRRSLSLLASAAALALTLGASGAARASGLLIADGGLGGALEIVSQDVTVTIDNAVAVTTVEQVFHNTENRPLEALYTFPVPKNASVAGFSMWINGKEMVGEVLEKKRAREIYDSYRRQQRPRDPGLLEQVDYRTFEMRVFPIAALAEQRVRLTYYQELDVDQDWMSYVYPLATLSRKGIDAHTGRFALNLDVRSLVPIVEARSPSHASDMAFVRHGDGYYQASLEQAAGEHLDRDVVLAFQLSRPHTGLDLVAHHEPGQDGTFALALSAGADVAERQTGMDYVFVLDVSGSMADGDKLDVSRDSVAAFVAALGPKDRFELLAFNIQARTAFGQLTPVSTDSLARARAFLSAQQPQGGTSLLPALTRAYTYAKDQPLNVLILSDGLTEQKERQPLLTGLASRPKGSRVFCIGVGNDVDRPLLEQLAEESGGLAAFLSRGDDFERQSQLFRAKLVRPEATDLVFRFSGVEVFDVEPQRLPSLYAGSPLRVYGRYRGGGKLQVQVTGKRGATPFEQAATLTLPEKDKAHPEIERIWALRRVQRLLKDADRTGSRDAVVAEVVRLGEAFAIATEYTSFLVLENDAEYQRWKVERRNALLLARDQAALAERRAAFDALRQKSLSDLGPEAVGLSKPAPTAAPGQPLASSQPSTAVPPQAPQPVARNNGRSADLPWGSGAVGPLFAAASLWLARRRRRAATRGAAS